MEIISVPFLFLVIGKGMTDNFCPKSCTTEAEGKGYGSTITKNHDSDLSELKRDP